MSPTPRPPARRRTALVTAVLLVLPVLAGVLGTAGAAEPAVVSGPVPRAECGPGSLPETDLQGRIPPADVASGRAAQGYTCNAEQVGFLPSSAGWRVHRYGDCAYYNGEPGGFPLQIATDPLHAGTYVLDVSDPANPVQTDFLRTPAMASPHESMDLHAGRGILVAVLGNLTTLPGVVEVYDVKTDCRHPKLLSSVNLAGVLGHEGGLSPDGMTYYVGSTGGNTLTAVDLADPSRPTTLAVEFVASHGLSLSPDGNLLYDAVAYGPEAGMIVYDVSEIQARKPGARFRALGRVTWPEISIPQSTIAVTIGGKPYVIESDEFDDFLGGSGRVGATRILDVADPRAPRVVSNVRLEVHEPEHRDTLADDTSALIGGPYSGHFCSVPRLEDPEILACSMLRSGVRVFDIRDPEAPREVAYFSPPAGQDCLTEGRGTRPCLHTGSTVAFVPERKEMWISGQESGFHVVRLTNGVWGSAPADAAPPATAGAQPPQVDAAAAAPPVTTAAQPVANARTLPETGVGVGVAALGALLLGVAGVAGSLTRRTPS